MSRGASRRVEAILDDLEHFGVKLGLDRTRRVLEELGSPQQSFSVVLVAGTNGKGSTAAWLASIVSAAGYRSGLFTSPHLERVEERLRVDGRAVETARLADLLERVVAASRATGAEVVTYFEALMAAACRLFEEEAVDLAVLEVGLGGRLDATNVTEPILSLITELSFDHQRQLGRTLPEIAREKAGILRPGRPALASTRRPEAKETLRSIADAMGCDLAFVADLTRVESRRELGAAGQRVALRAAGDLFELEPRLSGAHQAENLALAVAAAQRLAGDLPGIDRAAIEHGIAACRWPGRLERIALPDGGEVLFDCAHNPAGLEALRSYLEGLDVGYALVFGMLREKVDPGTVARLWRDADTVIVTQPDSPRAMPADELVSLVGVEVDTRHQEPAAALDAALADAALVVVCGSLYLVGELRSWLRSTRGVPAPAESLFAPRRGAAERSQERAGA